MNLARPLAYFLITVEVVECVLLRKLKESAKTELTSPINNSSLITSKGIYFRNDEELFDEARKKQKGQGQDMMSKILPMLIIPFMISTSIIPMMLISLKFMLMKSAATGFIAIILMLLNLLRGRNDDGGVYSHNINQKDLAMAHYGYGGDEEYGAYIHRSFR